MYGSSNWFLRHVLKNWNNRREKTTVAGRQQGTHHCEGCQLDEYTRTAKPPSYNM